MHCITNGYKRLFTEQLVWSEATCPLSGALCNWALMLLKGGNAINSTYLINLDPSFRHVLLLVTLSPVQIYVSFSQPAQIHFIHFVILFITIKLWTKLYWKKKNAFLQQQMFTWFSLSLLTGWQSCRLWRSSRTWWKDSRSSIPVSWRDTRTKTEKAIVVNLIKPL